MNLFGNIMRDFFFSPISFRAISNYDHPHEHFDPWIHGEENSDITVTPGLYNEVTLTVTYTNNKSKYTLNEKLKHIFKYGLRKVDDEILLFVCFWSGCRWYRLGNKDLDEISRVEFVHYELIDGLLLFSYDWLERSFERPLETVVYNDYVYFNPLTNEKKPLTCVRWSTKPPAVCQNVAVTVQGTKVIGFLPKEDRIIWDLELKLESNTETEIQCRYLGHELGLICLHDHGEDHRSMIFDMITGDIVIENVPDWVGVRPTVTSPPLYVEINEDHPGLIIS